MNICSNPGKTIRIKKHVWYAEMERIMRKNNTVRNMTIAALLGGMGVAGYMYMKNNPKVMRNIMGMMKDMEKAKLSMLDKAE